MDQQLSAASSPSSELRLLFETTFSDYEKRTGINLLEHQFSTILKSCDAAESIVAAFRNEIQVLNKFRGDDAATIMKWLKRIVRLSHPLFVNGVLANAFASLSFPPNKAFYAGLGVLLIAIDASQVSTNYDMLIDLFRSLEAFLKRLNTHIKMPLTNVMTETVVRILLQLLSTLGLATQQVNQGRLERVGEMLLGENDVEAVLQRLGNTSQNESRTAAGQALEIIYGLVQNMKALMNDGKASTDDIKYALGDQLVKDVRVWLSPANPSESHKMARKVHHPGTGAWFIQGHTFAEWKRTGSLLWIHGKPGSGKSVLCSTIIQEITTMREAGLASMAYFYFDFRDRAKQDFSGLLSSLLVQLCKQSDLCFDILSHLYSTHEGGSVQPSDDALLDCLKDMLGLLGQGPIYIILDGLDESPKSSGTPSKREIILELVEWLVNLRGSNLRICVSSCAETDIRGVLQPLASQIVSLHDEMGHIEDINDYINFFVNSDAKMGKWRNEDKDFVVNKLSEESGGMYGVTFLCASRDLFKYWYRFRWVFCQLDQLRRCLPEGIRGTFNEFPETLKEAYERILQDIDEKRWMCAHRLFQCLAVASRPLRVSELGEFLAWDFRPDLPVFVASWRPEDLEDALLSTCSSLIAIVNMDGSSVVQFSHVSVRQFLSSSHLSAAARGAARYHFSLEQAHFTVGQGCLAALLQLDKHINKSSIVDFPLAVYAAQYVAFHASSWCAKGCIQAALTRLFDRNKPHFAIWLWIYNVDENSGESMTSETPSQPPMTPLYCASQSGLYNTVTLLLYAGNSLSEACGYYGTPLIAASAKGHIEIVQKLLQNGADINAVGPNGRTALYSALEKGHRNIVEQLLEKNANVNTWFMDRYTPLGEALEKGYSEIIGLLFQRRASVNHQNRFGETLLHQVSLGRYDLGFAELLLAHGASVDTQDNRGRTPLDVARKSGNDEFVQLLSEHISGKN
ncbi:hypothetical protein B0F90DRAFT_1819812 [Multifurca ochricompacta]|uniref:NACHT domain-containing protein n=1 Tax=Multifurca ochricompacta TaxID=376703 RepID=A0AAD4M0G1_9AGAM|nr:hypothetical protein B0F90DRAFT_1819812 [Multifurca ochricompacta]